MMLIEEYEMRGINVISANTDGITVRIKKSSLEAMKTINEWWMNLTGYELERTDYQKIIFSTVNDYIAIKTNGEVKKKGDFVTDFELYKISQVELSQMALNNIFLIIYLLSILLGIILTSMTFA
jgi:DNA polymerase elongation subunit (family B)